MLTQVGYSILNSDERCYFFLDPFHWWETNFLCEGKSSCSQDLFRGWARMRTEEEDDEDGRGFEKVKTVPRTLLRDLMILTRNLRNRMGRISWTQMRMEEELRPLRNSKETIEESDEFYLKSWARMRIAGKFRIWSNSSRKLLRNLRNFTSGC